MNPDFDVTRRNLAKNARRNFLLMTISFEGGLLLIALAVGCFLKRPPWMQITVSAEALGWGIIATLPLLALLGITYNSRIQSLVRIRQIVQEILGSSLLASGWLDLCCVAILAGVSEEVFFRGVLEPLLGHWGPVVAIIGCNILFGICHSITPMYFAYSALIGTYLSLTLQWTSDPNLAVPIICHSLYDFVAFALLRRSCQIDRLP